MGIFVNRGLCHFFIAYKNRIFLPDNVQLLCRKSRVPKIFYMQTKVLVENPYLCGGERVLSPITSLVNKEEALCSSCDMET